MNKNEVILMREEMEEALKSVAAKHNCRVSVGSIGFDFVGLTASVSFKDDSPKARGFYNASFKDIEGFDMSKPIIGAKAEISNGDIVTITDYVPKNYKNPVIFEKKGNSYKTAIERLIRIIY